MATIKTNFQCDECDSTVHITVKSKEYNSISDIRSCPICGAPVPYSDEESDED
jgi:hypothetical protein